MRLFISSYRAGKHSEQLVELFGKGNKIAVITNAKDDQEEGERKAGVKENLDFFNQIGLKPEEIDLRKYFQNSKELKQNLGKFNAFWLAGGNTFLLRRALRQSQFEPLLGDWVRHNNIVLGGESAGALILGPTLKGADGADDPNSIGEGYEDKIIWEGLDFVSYVPVPHYESPNSGHLIDEYIDYLKSQRIFYKTLTDDQAIIINGDKEEFLE